MVRWVDFVNMSRWKRKWWIPQQRSGRSGWVCAEGNECPLRENDPQLCGCSGRVLCMKPTD